MASLAPTPGKTGGVLTVMKRKDCGAIGQRASMTTEFQPAAGSLSGGGPDELRRTGDATTLRMRGGWAPGVRRDARRVWE